MAEGIRALGKTSISQVNREDLMTVNEMFAKGLDIPMVYNAYDPVVENVENVPKVRRLKL